LIAAISWAVSLLASPWDLLWCAIAALIATNIESLIGATLQEKYDWHTNELVNGINTTIGAAIAVLITQLLLIFNLKLT